MPCKEPREVAYEPFYLFLAIELNALCQNCKYAKCCGTKMFASLQMDLQRAKDCVQRANPLHLFPPRACKLHWCKGLFQGVRLGENSLGFKKKAL